MANGTKSYSRRQLALRRLFLDGRGNLNADARVIVADLRRYCKVGNSILQSSAQTGAIDPLATAAAAARRELWDRYVKLLCVDVIEVLTVQEEDQG